jgi:subtilisin family serine protease
MLRKLLVFFLLLSTIQFPVSQVQASSPADLAFARAYQQGDAIPGEVVAFFEQGQLVRAMRFPANVRMDRYRPSLEKLGAAVLTVPAGQEAAYRSKLQKLDGIRLVEPNYIARAALVPNDPSWPLQPGPAQVQAPAAWDVTTGSSGVILAIIDSGIDTAHPEFSGRILPGYDFVDGDSVPQDDCGHGTHVAGIAAAGGNNTQGIAGITWGAQILPVRVLYADRAVSGACVGSFADLAEGVVWAVERGARVINLSVGGPFPSALLESATYYAYTRGAALIAAAGNSGPPVAPLASSVGYPARYPWVLAVSSVDSASLPAATSSAGPEVDIASPGVNIFSTLPLSTGFLYNETCGLYQPPCERTPSYDYLGGTSMATPHVSGAAALLASLPAFDSPDKIYQALTATALDIDAPGFDIYTGYGLLQIANALAFTPTITPTPTPVPPAVSYDILNSTTCENLVTYNWVEIASIPNQVVFTTGNANDGSATLSLPFTFDLGGAGYTSLRIGSNGYLTFGGESATPYENFIIPASALPNHFVAPYFDDLTASSGGSVYRAVLGSAPNRQVVIQYQDVQRFIRDTFPYDITANLTFEVILYETSNEILFQYKTISGDGADGSSASIGIEYNNGRDGREYAYNRSGALTPGLALKFAPYPTGGTPPSTACSAYTRPVDETGGLFNAPPFCLDIPNGALDGPATLTIQPLASAPRMPASVTDLRHYADITLDTWPAPPLAPVPEAYVCYYYTSDDLLAAGGLPENLSIVAYNDSLRRWDILPTLVDLPNQRIYARAPHFSIYGVAAPGRPQALPETGAPLAPAAVPWLAAGVLFLVWIWIRRRARA